MTPATNPNLKYPGRGFNPDCRTARFGRLGTAGLTPSELEEHRHREREKMRRWRSENRDRANCYQRERLLDPQERIAQSIRSRLSNALRWRKAGKPANTTALQGCSFGELMVHLECQFVDGMSFKNYGEWHVDHKIALAKFDLTDIEQLRKACHFSNLQPLWGSDNLSKGAR